MIILCRFFAIFFFCQSLYGNITPPPSDSVAETFVQHVGNDGIAVLKLPISDDDKIKKLTDILRSRFDVPWIGRFVMGRYWKRLEGNSPEKQQLQKDFLAKFESMLLAIYAKKFLDVKDVARFTVFPPAIKDPEEPDSLWVKTEIVINVGAPAPLKWKLIQKNGQLKIVDLVVLDDALSLAAMLRQDFASVMTNADEGSIEPVMQYMDFRLSF